jgi:hypothetical protein
VGGIAPGARNVISGNNSDGIELSGTLCRGNRIEGNYIGTDSTGRLDRGNSANGVFLNAAAGNIVGGAAPGAGNLNTAT